LFEITEDWPLLTRPINYPKFILVGDHDEDVLDATLRFEVTATSDLLNFKINASKLWDEANPYPPYYYRLDIFLDEQIPPVGRYGLTLSASSRTQIGKTSSVVLDVKSISQTK
jgi:hypothetical protein